MPHVPLDLLLSSESKEFYGFSEFAIMSSSKKISEQDVENAIEAAGIDVPPTSMMPFRERSRSSVSSGTVDNNKPPIVFGSLWRECVSLFTLACAPGLNVSTSSI